MNTLEAMAKAIYESIYTGEKWEDATETDRAIAFTHARTARDALAESVDHSMVLALSLQVSNRKTYFKGLAAAIRAAGEG